MFSKEITVSYFQELKNWKTMVSWARWFFFSNYVEQSYHLKPISKEIDITLQSIHVNGSDDHAFTNINAI